MATTGGRIMTMEQEFFEAFGIEPTMLCNCSYKNLQEYRYEYGDDVCEHIDDFEFSCKDCEKSKKSIPYYPPITPEIVLKLIKVIADKGYSFKVFEAEDMFNNGIKYITNAITDIKHDIYGRGKTIDEAVISLCIQLKDEIQDQVKALFNAM